MDLDTILGLLFFVFFVLLPLFSRGARGKKGQAGKGQATGSGRTSAPNAGVPTSARPTASTGRDGPSATLAEIRRRVEEAQRREAERARMSGKAATAQAPASARRPGTLVGSDPFEGALVSAPERRLEDLGEGRPTGLGREGMAGEQRMPPGAGTTPPRGLGREATSSRGAPSPVGREGMPGRMGERYVIGREGTARGARLDTGSPIGREGIGGQEGIGSVPADAGLIGREGARKAVSPSVIPLTRTARRIAKAAMAEIGSEGLRGDGGRPGARSAAARLGRAEVLQTDRAGILRGLIWHEVLSPPHALRHRRKR